MHKELEGSIKLAKKESKMNGSTAKEPTAKEPTANGLTTNGQTANTQGLCESGSDEPISSSINIIRDEQKLPAKNDINENRNHVCISFNAISLNESFARMSVAAFLMAADPTLEELDDVKTAVSEAVTNVIVHSGASEVEMECTYENHRLIAVIRDQGVGIADIAKAREPFYTSRPDLERSGMGFAFMEAFMDEVRVESEPGKGTCVTMTKHLGEYE